MNTDLITIAGIAQLFAQTPKHVRDRVVHEPDFPTPALVAGPRSRLWRREDVIAWATPAGRDALEEPLQDFPFAEVIVEGLMAIEAHAASILKAANVAIRQAKGRSPRSGREWGLEFSDAAFFLKRQDYKCAVSGVPFSLESVGLAKTRPYAPSVDRIDSSKGYVLDNVRFVCMSVNFLMNSWGDEVYKRVARPHAHTG